MVVSSNLTLPALAVVAEWPIAPDCKSGGLVPTLVRIRLTALLRIWRNGSVTVCPTEDAGSSPVIRSQTPVAQWLEQRPDKPQVAGSIPAGRMGNRLKRLLVNTRSSTVRADLGGTEYSMIIPSLNLQSGHVLWLLGACSSQRKDCWFEPSRVY